MIVGIDLGTTNSAIAVWLDGRPQLIPNSLGSFLTPSAVSVDEEGGVLVGMAARERQVTHPKATATTFKRWMGTQRVTSLGPNLTFRAEELSALVLRSLKADAEAFLKETVTEAVITVPAYFNDHQRKATRHAGELAGLKVERLLNEPTAAALAHGLHQRSLDTQFLVFDLGGGTFDVSIVEIFEGIIEVRSSAGDIHLGGEDFNQVLIEDFYAAQGPALGPPFLLMCMVIIAIAHRTPALNLTVQQLRIRHYLTFVPTVFLAWEPSHEDLTSLQRVGGMLFMIGVAVSMGASLYNDWKASREGAPWKTTNA